MAFVELCPGTFRMGSEGGDNDERPVRRVTLSAFAIGKYEVTTEQYRQVHPNHWGDANLPVTSVSWHEAQKFCEQLGFRLPTEVEWEYAARAGTTTAWSFGNDKSQVTRYAWFEGNSGGLAHPVGQKEANPWGLHDMHGNVWEWIEDWFEANPQGSQTDPTGPSSEVSKVLRGGSFGTSPDFLQSAFRNWEVPEGENQFIGFRCARRHRRQP